MFACWLVYVVVIIRASPHNRARDDLFIQDWTEDSSLPVELASADIFNDGTSAPSTTFADDDSTGDLFLNPVDGSSVATLDSGQDFDVKEIPPIEQNFDPFLFSVDEEGGESFVGNIALTSDRYDADENFPIDVLDPSISTAPCSSQGGPSFESLDSSSSTFVPNLGGNPDLIASDDLTPEGPNLPDPARRRPGGRYTIEQIYELGPDIGPNVDADAAYAADGTPVKPARCPPGHKKSCCTDDTHAACWYHPLNMPVCRYGRSLYCCKDIPQQGGPGTGCQTMQWVYDRTRSRRKPPKNEPNKLQGIFDIFQFPDLSPDTNPRYCPNPSHF